MSEFHSLTEAQQSAVTEAVELVRKQGYQHTVNMPDGGEAYAYPCGRGIAWGFNHAVTGFCIARGVVEG